MEQIVGWGLIIALLCHISFLLFAAVNLFRGVTGRALLVASLLSVLWIASVFHPLTAALRPITEILVLLAWQGLILRALGFRFRERRQSQAVLKQIAFTSLASAVVGITTFASQIFLNAKLPIYLVPLCFIVLNVTGLVLIEQLARNVVRENAWRIRYLNIGLGLIFGFGVLLWALRLAIGPNAELLAVLQPLVASLALIPLVIASLRNASNRLRFNLSRQFVFRTGILAATGVFLVSLSLLSYIGQLVGGDLGLTAAIFVGIVLALLLFAIVGSTRFRSTARVLLTKNFFESRYDYRDEWKNLTQRFSEQGPDHTLVDHIQISLATLLNAKRASLWLMEEHNFRNEGVFGDRDWESSLSNDCSEAIHQFYTAKDWVLDLSDPPEDASALARQVQTEQPNANYLVPLFLSDSLYAICLIGESEVKGYKLDWEDFDILKMTARQCASFLALASANKALIEHEKFAAVAQMSAFLSHDIKTINAQLVLLLENAEKHKTNPAFIDDMLKTIENSTRRMSKISTGLSNPTEELSGDFEVSDLAGLLHKWHAIDLTNEPRVSIECSSTVNVPSEYKTAINHLARNALESSPEAMLNVGVEVDSNVVYISLKDNGPGMSEDFVRDKLFEPFHSSKGVTGMGIGAFQAKTIVEKHGGDLSVISTLGEGTSFTIAYPLNKVR